MKKSRKKKAAKKLLKTVKPRAYREGRDEGWLDGAIDALQHLGLKDDDILHLIVHADEAELRVSLTRRRQVRLLRQLRSLPTEVREAIEVHLTREGLDLCIKCVLQAIQNSPLGKSYIEPFVWKTSELRTLRSDAPAFAHPEVRSSAPK